jgi:hypothetical protein
MVERWGFCLINKKWSKGGIVKREKLIERMNLLLVIYGCIYGNYWE